MNGRTSAPSRWRRPTRSSTPTTTCCSPRRPPPAKPRRRSSHPHRVLGGSAPLGGGALHRAAQSAHQRPVLPPGGLVRAGRHPGVALARRRGAIAQSPDAQASFGHSADHAGVARGAADAQACPRPALVLRPTVCGHRRGAFALAGGPRRADALLDRAALAHGGCEPAPYWTVGHCGRTGARGCVLGGRHRTRHRHPASAGAGAHVAAVHGALLQHRPAGERGAEA